MSWPSAGRSEERMKLQGNGRDTGPAEADSPEFLSFLDEAPVMMWISDADHGGMYFNAAWLAFRGTTLEQETNGGYLAAIHPDDLGNIEGYADALDGERSFQYEYRLRRHDGEWRWVLDSGRPRYAPCGKHLGYIGTCIDITLRRQSEAALRLSEARLNLAQESASIGTYDWDVMSDEILWSSEMYGLYGIPPRACAVSSATLMEAWQSRLHDDDRERCLAELESAAADGDRTGSSFRINHPELGLRWIEGRGRIFRDDAGNPLRVIGVNFDVTEQRRAEQALAESESRFRSLAENFPGFLYRRVTYPDGRVEYPVFAGGDENFLGLGAAAISKLRSMDDFLDFIHPDDLELVIERFRHATRTRTRLEYEARVLGSNDKYHWVHSVTRPQLREDGATVWDGVVLDVTEERQRSSARERTATMLRLGAVLGEIGTWEYDPEARSLVTSDCINQLFGLPPSEEPRPIDLYLEKVVEEDRKIAGVGVLTKADRGTETASSYRVKASSGEVRWVKTRSRFETLPNGSSRLIGVLTDITHEKRREDELAAALAQRQMLVAEQNRRTKTSLQLVKSMLRLDASRDTPAASALEATLGRIDAISDLHEQLGDTERVDFARYVESLAAKLRNSMLQGLPVTLECQTLECDLDHEQAGLLGFVVHELVTDTIRHAFPPGADGQIRLVLAHADDGAVEITVSNNSHGSEARSTDDTGPGIDLLDGLCRQIGASLTYLGGPDGGYLIRLPPAQAES